jgi:hypothetical protein
LAIFLASGYSSKKIVGECVMAKLMKRKLKSGQRALTAAADPPSDNVDEEPLNLNLIAVADSSDAEEEGEEEDGDDGDDAAEVNRFGERDTRAGNGTASSDEDEDLDSDYLGEDESETSEEEDDDDDDDVDDVTRDIREAIEDYVMGPEDNGREGVKEPEAKGIQAGHDIANDEDDQPKIEESDSSEDEVRIFLGL